MRLRAALALVVVAPLAVALGLFARGAGAEDWTISRFVAEYVISDDATATVTEDIEVDFGNLPSHGIFRDLTTDVPCEAFLRSLEETVPCEEGYNRHYDYSAFAVESVDDAGRTSAIPWERLAEHHGIRLKIGDPDVLVTGTQRYRITYAVTGALDALSDRDQFFWNVTGRWQTTVLQATVRVRLASDANATVVECYQGTPDSSTACAIAGTRSAPSFSSKTPVFTWEELTVRVGWPKGTLAIPAPLYSKDRTWRDFFTLDAIELVGGGVLAVLAVAGAFGIWYRRGRDRRYTTIHYLTGDTTEASPGLFAPDDVVVEYTPPDRLRPAQLTMVMNEDATPRDVTATIVDLAVRGYVRINEEVQERRFAPDTTDWRLERLKANDQDLLPYEAKLLDGLFQGGTTEVTISSLKEKFAARMSDVQKEIVRDAVRRKWFTSPPGSVRGRWLGIGIAVTVAGCAAAYVTGMAFDRVLLGAPVALLGLSIVIVSRFMSRRTAAGAEARRRALGFHLYVNTAETRLQEFNEQRNLFAAYLPYAIAFECVDKWANAFKDLANEAAESTSSWYHGAGPFNPVVFGAGMSSFSSGVSSTLASSASSSSGGSVGSFGGGGGGGGGGGRW